MADAYQQQGNTDRYTLEDGSGVYLLEGTQFSGGGHFGFPVARYQPAEPEPYIVQPNHTQYAPLYGRTTAVSSQAPQPWFMQYPVTPPRLEAEPLPVQPRHGLEPWRNSVRYTNRFWAWTDPTRILDPPLDVKPQHGLEPYGRNTVRYLQRLWLWQLPQRVDAEPQPIQPKHDLTLYRNTLFYVVRLWTWPPTRVTVEQEQITPPAGVDLTLFRNTNVTPPASQVVNRFWFWNDPIRILDPELSVRPVHDLTPYRNTLRYLTRLWAWQDPQRVGEVEVNLPPRHDLTPYRNTVRYTNRFWMWPAASFTQVDVDTPRPRHDLTPYRNTVRYTNRFWMWTSHRPPVEREERAPAPPMYDLAAYRLTPGVVVVVTVQVQPIAGVQQTVVLGAQQIAEAGVGGLDIRTGRGVVTVTTAGVRIDTGVVE